MKRIIVPVVLVIVAVVLTGGLVYGGNLSFESFRAAIEKVAPEGFTLNPSRTTGNRFSFRVEFKGDQSKMEMLSFALLPGKEAFSEMSMAFKPKTLTILGRKAIYIDAGNTGMASLVIILKNKTGRFAIRHRVMGGKALTLPGFQALIEKLNLDEWDK